MGRRKPDTVVGVMRQIVEDDVRSGSFYAYTGSGAANFRDRFDRLPHDALCADAIAYGNRLREWGVAPADICLIASDDIRPTLVAFLGAVSIGAVPAIHPAPAPMRGSRAFAARLASWYRRFGHRAWVLAENDTLEIVAASGIQQDRIIQLELDESGGGSPVDLDRLHSPSADDIAFLQITSGTTGDGKAVAVPHGAIFAEVVGLRVPLGWGPDIVLASWGPLYHDMGLVGGILSVLIPGATGVLFKPSRFLMSPAAWLKAIGVFGVTHMVMPDFGYAYCAAHAARKGMEPDVDFSTLRAAITSAEPVRDRTLRRFAQQFAGVGFTPNTFTPCYGMAETTLAATMPRHGTSTNFIEIDRGSVDVGETVNVLGHGTLDEGQVSKDRRENGRTVLYSNGRPFDGCDIRAVDEAGNVMADGVLGELRIAGPVVAAGYLDNDNGGLEAFGPLGLRTGDLGFLLEGEVFVVDRMKNVIIRRGTNHSASELEQLLGDAADVAGHRIMVFETDIIEDDMPVVAMIEERNEPEQRRVLKQLTACQRELGLPVDEVVFVRHGALPKTTSGKKRHVAARDALKRAEIEVLSRHRLQELASTDASALAERAPQNDFKPAFTEIEAAIVKISGAILRREIQADGTVDSLKLAEDLGADSLQIFEIALTVQERFGVELREQDLTEIRTVGDLARRIGDLHEPGIRTVVLRDDEQDVGLSMVESVLVDQTPQLFSTVTRQVGRRLEIDGRDVIDLASCNYLGLDLHADVMAAVSPMIEQWGVHPSWTRAVASPQPYADLEERLSELLGTGSVVVFPSVTLLHMGVLPEVLGRDGVAVVDAHAHMSIREACHLAEAKGSRVEVLPHNDLNGFEDALRAAKSAPKRVIVVDGVYSMNGDIAPLTDLRALAERYDAFLYVDDAHGFGVYGESPDESAVYGYSGNGVANHLGLSLFDERLIYIAGLSKAFSSMGAFVTCATANLGRIAQTSSTYVFSGPVPVASLASALAGLDVNAREGGAIRKRLADRAKQFVDGARDAGFEVDAEPGQTPFPIIFVRLDGSVSQVLRACQELWQSEPALLMTPGVYPSVPLGSAGLRFQLTATHSEQDIADSIAVLTTLQDKFGYA